MRHTANHHTRCSDFNCIRNLHNHDVTLTHAKKEPKPTSSTSSRQLPEPSADKSEIKQTLKEHRICFYFTYRMECPHKLCRYLHGQATLPFSYYSGVCRNNPALAAFEAMTGMHNAYEVTMPSFE